MAGVEAEFDVALSFAGEEREFVESVAKILSQSGVRIFYDRDAEVYLWGKDLGDALDEIYRLRSRYVVMFISSAYAHKMWTNHERKSALAHAIQESREVVLPARFDDTQLSGLRPTIAYIDLRRETAAGFAAKIIAKLGSLPASDDVPLDVPRLLGKTVMDIENHYGHGREAMLLRVGDAPELSDGGESRTYTLGRYTFFVFYDRDGIARGLQVTDGLVDESLSIDQWPLVLPRFGFSVAQMPDRDAPAGKHWNDFHGYKISVFAAKLHGPVWSIMVWKLLGAQRLMLSS